MSSDESLSTARQTLKLLLEAPEPSLDLLFSDPKPLVSAQAKSAEALLKKSLELIITTWSSDDKASFIHGHPRIGKPAVNTELSALSAKEQGVGRVEVSEEVLERLRKGNELYENMFPNLRYITFVNGRTRAQIADELDEFITSKQQQQEPHGEKTVYEIGSAEWEEELGRAIKDIGLIAYARLSTMNAP